ncbi:MAG: hypothetical protein AMXMBFR4_08690 [Candidatus Hydrogenedentota bacterium]
MIRGPYEVYTAQKGGEKSFQRSLLEFLSCVLGESLAPLASVIQHAENVCRLVDKIGHVDFLEGGKD